MKGVEGAEEEERLKKKKKALCDPIVWSAATSVNQQTPWLAASRPRSLFFLRLFPFRDTFRPTGRTSRLEPCKPAPSPGHRATHTFRSAKIARLRLRAVALPRPADS